MVLVRTTTTPAEIFFYNFAQDSDKILQYIATLFRIKCDENAGKKSMKSCSSFCDNPVNVIRDILRESYSTF